jgi:hypothetical protein
MIVALFINYKYRFPSGNSKGHGLISDGNYDRPSDGEGRRVGSLAKASCHDGEAERAGALNLDASPLTGLPGTSIERNWSAAKEGKCLPSATWTLTLQALRGQVRIRLGTEIIKEVAKILTPT